MEKNERKSGAILSYISIVINTLVQLLYTPLLIRMLGQSEYGLYSLVSSIIGYLTVLDLGFGNAIVVYTAKYRAKGQVDEEKKLHGMFFVIFCIIGIIATILGLIIYFTSPHIFANTMTPAEISKIKTMMLILTFNLAITFPFSVYSSIINAYEKFIFQKILSIINTILKPIIMIPLLFLGYKSITMCIIITIINIGVIISNYLYCKKKLYIRIKFMGFDKVLFKTILNYSFFIFLAIVVDKINWNVDQFILGAVSGSIAVSVYSVASQINSLFINLSTAISGVMLPKVTEMVAKKATNEELTKEFIKIGRIQFMVIFLMISGLILFGKEFFIAWAGKSYSDSYYIALLLTIPLCIPLIQNLGLSIMQAKNMHRFRSILCLLIAFVNIIISIPLAKQFGGIGSALGTAISLLIGNGLIINIYYQKKVGINVIKFWKIIIKMIAPYILPITVTIIFMIMIPLKGYISIVVYGSIYTIMYFIISYWLVMNSYEKLLITNIFKKIRIFKRKNTV